MLSLPLHTAARCLHQGGILCYPTEAVFGLGCDPRDGDAVARLLEIKRRPVHKGVLLIAASLDQLDPWVRLTPAQRHQLEHWPLATSYLVDARPDVPAWIRGQHSKVGVRVTHHRTARALCEAFGGPIVSTSANLSGQPPVRNQFQAQRQFGQVVDMVVSGNCDLHSKPSTIIDLDTGAIVRA